MFPSSGVLLDVNSVTYHIALRKVKQSINRVILDVREKRSLA
jgi:hypothetical protein